MHLNLDTCLECKLCKNNIPCLNNIDIEKYSKHMRKEALYNFLYTIYLKHKKRLDQQGMNSITITVNDIRYHYDNCYINEAFILHEDIRACTKLQQMILEEVEDDVCKACKVFMEVSAHRLRLLNRLKKENKKDNIIQNPSFIDGK